MLSFQFWEFFKNTSGGCFFIKLINRVVSRGVNQGRGGGKFDATTRKLNCQYDIQLAITKIQFFAWYVATKCLSSISLRTLLLLCYMTVSRTLKVLKFAVLDFAIFAIFDHFRELLYPRKVWNPQNRKIKYPRNEIPPEFEILFFLIFDQSMILIPVYRISLLIITKLEVL